MDSLYVTDQESNWLSTLPPPSSEEIYMGRLCCDDDDSLDYLWKEVWMEERLEWTLQRETYRWVVFTALLIVGWRSSERTKQFNWGGDCLWTDLWVENIWRSRRKTSILLVGGWLGGWLMEIQTAIDDPTDERGAALVTEGKVRRWIDVDLSSE